jgi:hypothetical protein
MERDSGARNVGLREARIDLNPFNVKESDMDMEINFHSTPYLAHNSQKVNTTMRQDVYTDYSDDVNSRNPFLKEGRRLTWRDEKATSGRDHAVGISYESQSSLKGRLMRKSEFSADGPPISIHTGYGLPLTPMSTDQPAASAFSMTFDTNTSAYSETAAGIDVGKVTQTAMETDAPKLRARSENPFDIPLSVRPKNITYSTEATRKSAVELQPSSQQLDTLRGKNGSPQTIPLMQYGEHADVTLPSSLHGVDYDHLPRGLEHPLTRKSDRMDHSGYYHSNVTESPYQIGLLDAMGHGQTPQHHYFANLNHYEGRGRRTEGSVPQRIPVNETDERFSLTTPYRMKDVSSTAEISPDRSQVESQRNNQQWTREYASYPRFDTGHTYRVPDYFSATDKNCTGTPNAKNQAAERTLPLQKKSARDSYANVQGECDYEWQSAPKESDFRYDVGNEQLRETTRSVARRPAMKPDKFDTKRVPLNTFLIQFETCSRYNNWSEDEKAAQLKCSLSGDAAQILWDCPDADKMSFAELVGKLKARYGTTGQREKFAVELRALRRKKNQSIAELYHDVRRLMVLAYPECGNSELFEVISRDHFLRALDDVELEIRVREKEPTDLDAAFKAALRIEACIKSLDAEDRTPRFRRSREDDRNNRQVRVDELTSRDRVKELEQQVNDLRKHSEELRHQRDQYDKELGRLKCMVAEAPKATGKPARDTGTESKRNPKCFRCGRLGHFARSCSESVETRHTAEVSQASGATNVERKQSETKVITNNHGNQPADDNPGTYLRCRIYGERHKCLLDTGSEVSLVPVTMIGNLQLEPTPHKLSAANGTPIVVLGRAKVPIYLGTRRFTVDALVTEHVLEMIIGISWLKEHRAKWDFHHNKISIDGVSHTLCSKHENAWCRRVIVAEDVTIPPRSEYVLMTNVAYRDISAAQSTNDDEWMTEASEPVRGLHVPHTLIASDVHKVPVRIMNSTAKPITLKARTVVADMNPVEAVLPSDSAEPHDETYEQIINELVSRVHAEVSESGRSQLKDLLMEFKHAFSTGDNNLGSTTVVAHEIDTGNAKPVRQPLRRHPPAHLEAIRQHVASMLEQGVIEPAQSPWASNVVLVKKKDDTLRCCIDYRNLNAVTHKVAYPLPRTDMCLDAMSGACWFSTFDLRSSYHQVPLLPKDADKTAFICREGMYRFKKMPFGLCNAGATFQRLMDITLSGLSFEVCLAYLDDIIVFSSDEASHMERLRLVLTRLLEAGLKLKPAKCALMRRSVLFLGHIISSDGIATDPQKTTAISEWPTPQNVKEVRTFLGICGYYRRFVDGFAAIAKPLYALTEKNRKFEWTTQSQEAFDRLKSSLTAPPILGMPNDTDQMVLDTDASNWAIGAVLSQRQGNVERVIAYASRKLSRSEANYCVTRRELLAIVYFLKYFRHYLLGRPFIVRTDHAALQWLRRTPDIAGQQARWLSVIEEYDFEIQHRPGARHGNADAMSRIPCRKTGCRCNDESDLQVRGISEMGINKDDHWAGEIDIAEAQDEDQELCVVKQMKIADAAAPSFDDIAGRSSLVKSLCRQYHRLVVEKDTLMRLFEVPQAATMTKQVVLPRSRRRPFITQVHESLGHLGLSRTKSAVQERAYWPGWSTDVEAVLRECTVCARYKRGSAPKQTYLRPFVSGEPFETVSIDITGPHPRSRNGFVYILTVQDHFTKWAEAIPLRNHTAPVVADALFKTCVHAFWHACQITE